MATIRAGTISPIARWLLPSYGTLLFLTAFAYALLIRGPKMFSWDGDVGRHLRVGHDILQHGAIPLTDAYSHTLGVHPVIPYESGAEAIMALADRLGGLPGVAILTALLFAAAVYGVYIGAQELGAPRPLALGAGLLSMLLQSIHLLPRPHLFSSALIALFLVLLLRYARSGRPWTLAWPPVLTVIWANTHPGFFIGFVLLGAFLVGALLCSPEFAPGRAAARPLGLALVACLAASLLSPAGIGSYTQSAGLLGNDFIMAATNEFQSVNFHLSYGKVFFAVLFAGPVLWMTGRVRVSWLGLGLFLFFAAAALTSVRYVPLFGIVALPWLAVWARDVLKAGRGEALLERFQRMDQDDRALRPWGWSAAVVGLMAVAVGPMAPAYRFDTTFFPTAALEHVGPQGPSGKLFNQMEWGGYLIYERPELPIFIDGMSHIFGEQLARRYLTALDAKPGWREVLDDYDVSWTLTRSAAPLNQLLALDPAWRLEYQDPVATIYRRD